MRRRGTVTRWQDVIAIPDGANWPTRAITQTTFYIPIVEAFFALERNARYSADPGPSRGNVCKRAIRPFETVGFVDQVLDFDH